jgi:hypothetical protein
VNIDWGTLAAIAVVAAAAALSVVLLVSFALVALSAGPGRTNGPDGGAPRSSIAVGRGIAVLCVLAAGSIVGYGLYLIIA